MRGSLFSVDAPTITFCCVLNNKFTARSQISHDGAKKSHLNLKLCLRCQADGGKALAFSMTDNKCLSCSRARPEAWRATSSLASGGDFVQPSSWCWCWCWRRCFQEVGNCRYVDQVRQ